MNNFLLISDLTGIENSLRHFLNTSGEDYSLTTTTYADSKITVLENDFDRIFCSVSKVGKTNINEQMKLVTLLDKTTSVPVVTITDNVSRPITRHLHLQSNTLEEINYTDIKEPGSDTSNAVMAQVFGATYADRQAERQRSEAKNKAISQLEIEIERLKLRMGECEEDVDQCRIFLNGGTAGMGLIYMTQFQQSEIEKLKQDIKMFNEIQEKKQNINLQKTAIIVGTIATLFGAIVPVCTEYLINKDKEKVEVINNVKQSRSY